MATAASVRRLPAPWPARWRRSRRPMPSGRCTISACASSSPARTAWRRRGRWRGGPVCPTGDRPSVIYELADEATLLAAVGAPAAVSAPAPGMPGFAPGEVSRYDVFWDGAGTQVSAGTVEIAVLAASGTDARLPRVARQMPTAPASATRRACRCRRRRGWRGSSRRATCSAPTRMQSSGPSSHLREIREGRRRVDQSVFHDGPGGVVRVVPPDAATVEAGPGFRAPQDHRDPIAAFLLVRTLALAAGTDVAFPSTTWGAISRCSPARSKPTRSSGAGSRSGPCGCVRRWCSVCNAGAPPEIDLWLSADPRRLPLRIDVAAGFGRVRVELSETRPGVPRT